MISQSSVASDFDTSRIFYFHLKDTLALESGLALLLSSVLSCRQYLDPGYLHQQNRLLFHIANEDERNLVYGKDWIRRHSRTACLQEDSLGQILVYRMDGFVGAYKEDSMNILSKERQHAWEYGSFVSKSQLYLQVFMQPKSYEGFQMRAAGYAYTYNLETLPPEDPTGLKMVGKFWGADLELLYFVHQNLK